MNYRRKGTTVSDEVDSICTRCKEETIHRVVAMVEGRVHLVICTRCGGQHRYRPTIEIKQKGVPRTTINRARKTKATQPLRLQEHMREWQNLKEKAGELQSLPYEISSSYRANQAIEHPKFGLGFVLKVIDDNKIQVFFQNDIKVLVMHGAGYTQT